MYICKQRSTQSHVTTPPHISIKHITLIMKDFKSIIAPLILALGILGMGFAIKGGIDNFAFRDREVNVRGLAERNVNANQVTWPVSYAITGDNLQTLYEQTTRDNKTVMEFLTSNGISEKDISINPPVVYDQSADQYSYNNGPKFKYKLTSTLTVLTSQVEKVRELLNRQGELLAKGIAFSNNEISYDYTQLNYIKPEMIAEATKNAREAADRFAADSESRLGKIKNAEQGYFSIDDADPSTPYIKRVRVVTNITFYLED